MAQLSSTSYYLSYFPATADIIIEVIEVDEIYKGNSGYVACVELIPLNDLLHSKTSLLSINQGLLILSRSGGQSEISLYEGRLHDLKTNKLGFLAQPLNLRGGGVERALECPTPFLRLRKTYPYTPSLNTCWSWRAKGQI